jgi:hypothetical protein
MFYVFRFFTFKSTETFFFFFFVILSVLRRLSSVERSRCAVKLDRRSIQLSVEEGRFLNLQQSSITIILLKNGNVNCFKTCLYHKRNELKCYYKILYMISQLRRRL